MYVCIYIYMKKTFLKKTICQITKKNGEKNLFTMVNEMHLMVLVFTRSTMIISLGNSVSNKP